MNSIEGKIRQIRFHKASKFNGQMYLIASLADGTTVKGNLDNPVVGEPYRFWGDLKPQKGNYGDAFEFVSVEPICDQSTSGMVQYLAAHVCGVGRKRAAALVERFGAETLTVLRTDAAKALEIEGITAEIVAAIRAHFDDAGALDPVAYSKLVELFAPYRIGKRIVERLVRTFGSGAPDRVIKNPYLLLGYPRIGWKTVDAFALSTAGYAPEGRERHRAAIVEVLERHAANGGHTCATESEILNAAHALLGCDLDHGILVELTEDGTLETTRDDYGTIYQLSDLAEAERTIAEKLAVLMAAGRPLPAPLVTDEWIEETGLGDDQARAAKMVEENGVMIIAGLPGCGKTFSLSRILGRLRTLGMSGIRVMCPTGKAAKRAAELLAQVEACVGIPCTTIHKALAPSPNVQADKVAREDAKFNRGREEFSFGKDEFHPFDESVIVVDETSMVDVKLMASLLRAVKPGTRLIMVGDWNQLPSVGPGSVLRDIRGLVPTAELTEIRRSDGGGTVVRACHAIAAGRVPQDADTIELPTHNWVHIEISDQDEIAAKIVELHATTRRFDPMWDMQVVSPRKEKMPIACDNLNRLLSQQLNSHAHDFPGDTETRDEEGGPGFRIGDKIIRTKNGLADELVPWGDDDERPDFHWNGTDYGVREIPVVNGDMGQVVDIIDGKRPAVIVRFRDPDRLVRLPFADSHIMLAYSVTVHKAQGSGFRYVIIPVHKAIYEGLATRENLFTAMSRMEEILITIGQWSAIEASVKRQTVHLRKTTLVRRLDEAITNTPRPDEVAAHVRLSKPPSEIREASPDLSDFATMLYERAGLAIVTQDEIDDARVTMEYLEACETA